MSKKFSKDSSSDEKPRSVMLNESSDDSLDLPSNEKDLTLMTDDFVITKFHRKKVVKIDENEFKDSLKKQLDLWIRSEAKDDCFHGFVDKKVVLVGHNKSADGSAGGMPFGIHSIANAGDGGLVNVLPDPCCEITFHANLPTRTNKARLSIASAG
ncbi:hypothetical protein Baya_12858 [Bagarius yarrelli]|uniref:Uncharacterized protein n=1 Tax=Bagarius yarrelli TaxID=175774 RepID=A0A556V4B3_BAGYA|nr:hypothetical protein Baya_12858 [Bagarius yarrelli]